MSQALNRLRAMVSLPKFSPPMPRPRRATALETSSRNARVATLQRLLGPPARLP
jgi:hypothetical protein